MNNSLKTVERRRFIRHPMCYPLKYAVLRKRSDVIAGDPIFMTKDVSENGLLFAAAKPVDSGEIIVLRIPFQDRIFKVKAKVIHCDKLVGQRLYDVGVCFYRAQDAFKARLVEQMYLISEYRDLRSMETGQEMSLREASEEWIKRYSKRFQKLYW